MSLVLARRGVLAGLGLAGLFIAVGAALLVATSEHLVDAIAYGIQIGVMVLGTVAASLYWLARRPGNRVGVILLALAVATAVLSLQGATEPLLHSLGVAADPIFFLLAYYAVFAFPDGRLTGRLEQALLAGMAIYFVTGFVPYLLFSPVVQGGAPLAGCIDCPTNALMIADRPAIAESYGSDGSYAVIAIMSATLACLIYRVATATRPRRRALLPVYVPAVMLTVPILIVHGVVTQLLHLEASTIWDIGWLVTLARCTLPFGFLLAIVQTTLFAATALKAIVGRLVDNPSASQLRRVLADALDDPALELAFRVDGTDSFVDSRGEPIAPTPAVGRSSTPVGRAGETAAMIVHDAALDTDPELVAAAGQALLLALENGRLLTELDSTTAELRASRARIVAAGDAERRRVARDLHDGAQQHLVALRIKVGLVGELAEADPQVALRLADLGSELEEILQELRDIGQGLNPPVLREFGLREALASVSRRSASPPKLETATIGRYPEEIETAVYFCCLEGLQNVDKHAGANASTVIRLWERDGELFLEIEDDGIGCDLESAQRSGNGFTNMMDRIASVGGNLAVESTPGLGTTVRGNLPVVGATGG